MWDFVGLSETRGCAGRAARGRAAGELGRAS